MLDPIASGSKPPEELLREAASAGVRLFQYRNKTDSALTVYRQALHLRQVAADVQALFIINDRCDLALAVEADGVHLGQDDLPVPLARSLMGPDKLIGISTHREADVQSAIAGGADYLGFGPIFSTASKRDHEPVVGLEELRRIRTLTRLPIFAIGGITANNVAAVVEAGADGVAVISALAQAADVPAAVRAFRAHLG
ncbi:MAG: thiamine phosphate synthase [Nitrospirae bacterium]|nr:MAG: thiamine phosphate synthase [Nitrospirota bacterium]